MEDHTPANKYQKHRQGLAHRLTDIQRQLAQLSEEVRVALRIQDKQQQQVEARDDCHR